MDIPIITLTYERAQKGKPRRMNIRVGEYYFQCYLSDPYNGHIWKFVRTSDNMRSGWRKKIDEFDEPNPIVAVKLALGMALAYRPDDVFRKSVKKKKGPASSTDPS